jgi:hypothetical protein
MGIDHRRLDIAMPQKLLDRSNVIAAFEQVGSIGTIRVSLTCRNDFSTACQVDQWRCQRMPPRMAAKGSALVLIFSGPAASIHDLLAGFRVDCGNLYEPAVVKPVPSHSSGQALSLSKERSRDLFAGRPLIHYDLPVSEVEGIAVFAIRSAYENDSAR